MKQEGVCVFTDRKKKALAFALVPILAINVYAGCRMLNKTSKNTERVKSTSIEKTIDENTISGETYLELDESSIVTEGLVESTLSQDNNGNVFVEPSTLINNVFAKLDTMYKTSGLEENEILNQDDRSQDLYVSALYVKLKKASIPDEIIIQELQNIIIYGSNATCMNDDEWYKLFGNLISTITIYDNVVDYYYPLAKYIHLHSCNLEHSPLFFDEFRITCQEIEDKYNELNPQIDINKYFSDMVNASNNIKLINQYNGLLNSGINLETLLCELESIYAFSMDTKQLTIEEYTLFFGNLHKSTPKGENAIEYYYDLAYYFHELWCDLEHQQNEYGKYTCDAYRLTLEI